MSLGVMYKNIHELFLTERNKDNMTKKNRFCNKITALAYKIISYNVKFIYQVLWCHNYSLEQGFANGRKVV